MATVKNIQYSALWRWDYRSLVPKKTKKSKSSQVLVEAIPFITIGLLFLSCLSINLTKPAVLKADVAGASTIQNPQPKKPQLPSFYAEAQPIPDYKMPENSELAPVISHISTTQPVVFLTIDDGITKDPAVIDYMHDNRIVASLFLNNYIISKNYDYFQKLVDDGSQIENHTLNHPRLTKIPPEKQRPEICENSNAFERAYGTRPELFRPPYGLYDDQTRKILPECGMKALIMWNVVAEKGTLHFQTGFNTLKPGDIILMHFKPGMVEDLKTFKAAADQAGLTISLLEDWL